MGKSQSTDNGIFWTYADINIPSIVNSVPSLDRVNTHYQDGTETKRFGEQEGYTLKEYQEKYAVIGRDGKLYWKKASDKNTYWKYANINIPSTLDNVPSLDGVNTHFKNGGETQQLKTQKRRIKLPKIKKFLSQ